MRAATVEAFPTTEAHGPFWVIACDVHAATLRQLKVEVYELDGEALVALAEQGAEQVGDRL